MKISGNYFSPITVIVTIILLASGNLVLILIASLGNLTILIFIAYKANHPNKKLKESLLTNPLKEKTPNSTISKIKKDERGIWILNQVSNLDNTISYFDLIKYKNIKEINYFDLLECFEWQFKRLQILIRDKHTCQICSKLDKRNHVHHKYYLKNKLPWDIDSNALITLCKKCHYKTHQTEKIKVFEKDNLGRLKETFYYELYCSRCDGSGYLPQFSHVENGICFACRGSCVNITIFSRALEEIKNEGNLQELEGFHRNEYKYFITSISENEFKNEIKPAYTEINTPNDLPF